MGEKLVEKAKETGGDVIIESIRTVGEAKTLHTCGAVLLSVDAPCELRYDRVVGRASSTDNVSFEKFKSDEEREMTNEDETKQNLGKVMEMSDHRLNNAGALEALHAQLDAIFDKDTEERPRKRAKLNCETAGA